MSETKLRVPASQAEVTKEWLQAALSNSFPSASVGSLVGERVGENYGFASRIFRYRWKNGIVPQSVVIKLWDTATKAGIGEVRFYQTIQDVGIRVPLCFYSAADEITMKGVVVLEDLKEAVQGDVLKQLDLKRAKGVARGLAKMHATWLEQPKLDELSWLPNVSTWESENAWFRSRRKAFLKRIQNRLSGLPGVLLDQLELAPKAANERLEKAPITLLHGDFHLDNIVFERDIEPVLLDWSRPLRGPSSLNVANLLFEMISLGKFDSVLASYLEEFNKVAGTSLNEEVFDKQLGGALLRQFELSTCGAALWQPPSLRGTEMAEAGIERVSNAVEFWERRDPELFSFLR